jgi:ATP-dependent DNA ligase
MTLPRVQPITPILRKEPFDGPGWLFDIKYDGFRGPCYVEHGRARFVSRNGKPLGRFAAVAAEVAAVLAVDELVIDGEVIVADETGRPQFYDLLRGTRAPAYVAFDLLWRDGADLRPLPLSERRSALRGFLAKPSPVIFEAVSVKGGGGAGSSSRSARTISRGSRRSVSLIRMARASGGSRSKTRTKRSR